MKYLSIALLGILLLSACSAYKNNSTTDPAAQNSNSISGKKWKLVSLYGKPVPDLVNGKEPFLKLAQNDSLYSASGGCNGLGGSYKVNTNGRIKFSQGFSTMMACEQMEIESQLKKIFSEVDNYTVNGDELSLNKAKMAPLAKFKIVQEVTATTQLNGTWEVDYISGTKIAFNGLYPDRKPTITFDVATAKATGNSSCNNFNTTFKIQNSNMIQFNPPMSTKMACEGDGETAFFTTLQTVNSFSINGNTLTLIKGDIAVMRLQKK